MRGICGVAGLRGKSVRGGVARGSRGVRVVFAGPAYTGTEASRGVRVVFAGNAWYLRVAGLMSRSL